jgi:hypothetical protein
MSSLIARQRRRRKRLVPARHDADTGANQVLFMGRAVIRPFTSPYDFGNGLARLCKSLPARALQAGMALTSAALPAIVARQTGARR